MIHRTYTVSLSVLASMLEAGTLQTVYISFHGVNPSDDSYASHNFTPEELRSMDKGRHKMVAVKETLFESTGTKKALIGGGLRNYVCERDRKWLGGSRIGVPAS